MTDEPSGQGDASQASPGQTTIDDGSVAQAAQDGKPRRRKPNPRHSAALTYDRLLLDKQLGHGAKILWLILRRHRNSRTGLCCPGYRTIAAEMGCDIGSIRGWLEALKAQRWLSWSEEHYRDPSDPRKPRQHPGKARRYVILDGTGKELGKPTQSVLGKPTQGKPIHSVGKTHTKPSPCPKDKGVGSDGVGGLGDTVARGSGLASAGLAPAEPPALSVDPSKAPDFIRTKF